MPKQIYSRRKIRRRILPKSECGGSSLRPMFDEILKDNPGIKEKEVADNNEAFESMRSAAEKLSKGALTAGTLPSYRK
jgi:hypothetical protein